MKIAGILAAILAVLLAAFVFIFYARTELTQKARSRAEATRELAVATIVSSRPEKGTVEPATGRAMLPPWAPAKGSAGASPETKGGDLGIQADFEEWRRIRLLDPQEDLPPWARNAGGSSLSRRQIGSAAIAWVSPGPGGELVGYSPPMATREAAVESARRSLREKLDALLRNELWKELGRIPPAEAQPLLEELAERTLKGEGDVHADEFRLPGSGETVHLAAVMAKVPGTFRQDLRQMRSALEAQAVAARREAIRTASTWGWTLVSAVFLALAVFLSYAFLNAGTKGHLAWPLRLLSLAAFAALCTALLYIRGHLT